MEMGTASKIAERLRDAVAGSDDEAVRARIEAEQAHRNDRGVAKTTPGRKS